MNSLLLVCQTRCVLCLMNVTRCIARPAESVVLSYLIRLFYKATVNCKKSLKDDDNMHTIMPVMQQRQITEVTSD